MHKINFTIIEHLFFRNISVWVPLIRDITHSKVGSCSMQGWDVCCVPREQVGLLHIINFTFSEYLNVRCSEYIVVRCFVHKSVHILHLHIHFMHHARPESPAAKEGSQNIFKSKLKPMKIRPKESVHGIGK